MSDRAIPNQVLLDFSDRKLLSPVPKNLYESAKTYFSKRELDLLQTAYNVAFEAHKDQFRKEGSAYITHPVEVASILIELNLDIETVCAGLMHDVLEDSFIKKSYLEKLFGKDVVAIVDGVSNLNKLDFNSIEDRNANNLQKMALAMSKDIRVIIVKLCDRLHNMRTIEFLPREKQIRKSIETLELYGPIAIRIGMQNIRIELEDLAFKCIHPMRARMLESAVKQTVGGRKKIISKLRKQFKYHLKNNDITATVKGRQKSLSSIYAKIKNKKKPFSEILDVYAFRVIVNSVDDVYRALGIIHNVHKPIGNRFKDYIAIPKTNGYQALHTSLIALDGVPIEVQIQTMSMEIIAQNGIAAHWSYKTKDAINSDLIGAKKWIEGFSDLKKASVDSHEFVEAIKTDLVYDEVYVFTPAGKIVNLKSGSTPIDFAYELHTELGNKAVACKVHANFHPTSSSPFLLLPKAFVFAFSFSSSSPSWSSSQLPSSRSRNGTPTHTAGAPASRRFEESAKTPTQDLRILFISFSLSFSFVDDGCVLFTKPPKEVFCLLSSLLLLFVLACSLSNEYARESDDFCTPKNEVSALSLLCSRCETRRRDDNASKSSFDWLSM